MSDFSDSPWYGNVSYLNEINGTPWTKLKRLPKPPPPLSPSLPKNTTHNGYFAIDNEQSIFIPPSSLVLVVLGCCICFIFVVTSGNLASNGMEAEEESDQAESINSEESPMGENWVSIFKFEQTSTELFLVMYQTTSSPLNCLLLFNYSKSCY